MLSANPTRQAALKALVTPKVNAAVVADTVCALVALSVYNSVQTGVDIRALCNSRE